MRRPLLGFAAAVLLAASGPAAADWIDTIVPEKSHDFGTVARGSKVRHVFRIVNTTAYDVHVADWRTKCGCTDVKVGARNIPPGTQTTVEVTFDTTRFEGFKASGLTLIFDQPQPAQVDLSVTSFIRGDVLLNPGNVDFQTVPRGSGATHTLTLTYSGSQADWAVTKLTTISDHVEAELRELSRVPGTIQYRLTTTLKPSAPPGYVRDEITLTTNDPNSPTIPITVAGSVQANVTVSPAILNLGHVVAGEAVTKSVLVRAGRPFKVTGATCAKPDLTATTALGESRSFHTLTVTFKAPAQAGPYNATMEIATDLDGEPPARLNMFATIDPVTRGGTGAYRANDATSGAPRANDAASPPT